MELLEAIKSRRTARCYSEIPVPLTTIEGLVESAANAPSACNRQRWRCILIQERASLDWLHSQGGSSVLKNCSQAIIVCYEADTENSEWHDNIQSAAAFIAYFQLIAHVRGVGSCWLCHLPPQKEIMGYFSIPVEYTPVAVVTFGYYQADISSPLRESNIKKILSREKWDFTDVHSGNPGEISTIRKIMRKIYYSLPFRSLLSSIAGRYEKKFDD